MIIIFLMMLYIICNQATAYPIVIDVQADENEISVYYDSTAGQFTVVAVSNVLELNESLTGGDTTVIMHGNLLPEVELVDAVKRADMLRQSPLKVSYQPPTVLTVLAAVAVFMMGFTIGLSWSVYQIRRRYSIPHIKTTMTSIEKKDPPAAEARVCGHRHSTLVMKI